MKQNRLTNQKAFDIQKQREQHCAKWLKSLHRSVRSPLRWATLVGSVNGVLTIAQAALLAFVLHQLIIEQRNWLELQTSLICLPAVFLARSVCVYLFQTFGFSAAATVKQHLRKELLHQLEQLGPAFLKQQHSGQLATIVLEQCEGVEKYFSRYVPQKSITGIVPFLILAAVFPVNWVAGTIFLVTGPLVPIFMVLIGMGAATASRNQFLELAWMSGYFLDRLQGLTTLKLFSQARSEVDRISQIADRFREKTMSVLRIAFLSSAVLEFFSAVAVALVAVYVGLGLLGLIRFGPANEMTLQEGMFVLLLAPEFFLPLRQLAINYHDRAEALGAADHILQVLEQPHEIDDISQSKTSEYHIELCDVSKVFQHRPVLNRIHLQVRVGEKLALVGETGSGKSTLLALLAGFETASSGQIWINGKTLTRAVATQQIAWLGQQAAIFYGTIADNIRLFDPDISSERVTNAAQAAGVKQFTDNLKEGLDTLIGEQGYGLSGGQNQRIALARAIVKEAPIVLLDEPTAHLDRRSKLELLDSIERLFKDKTVIIATHDIEVVERMDRWLHLVDGELR